jgi:hypothetical protein
MKSKSTYQTVEMLKARLSWQKSLYDKGMLMAHEHNAKTLEIINEARVALGLEPFDELPAQLRKDGCERFA